MTVRDARAHDPFTGAATFSLGNRVHRVVFRVAWLLLARWTPPPLHAWRATVLRLFGARLGRHCHVYSSAEIWLPSRLVMADHSTLGPGVRCYNMAQVTLAPYAIVSQRAHLCTGTHDVRDPAFQLHARPIAIGERAWIAAEAFVGPGVSVGDGAVLGARGCTFRDLEPWRIYTGNPAEPRGRRTLREEPDRPR